MLQNSISEAWFKERIHKYPSKLVPIHWPWMLVSPEHIKRCQEYKPEPLLYEFGVQNTMDVTQGSTGPPANTSGPD